MEHNKFTVFNFVTNLGHLPSLKTLKISNNHIDKLENVLKCESLRLLDLSGNKIGRFFVYEYLGTSPNLTVELRENNLESVDFRNLNDTRRDAKLFINLDDAITCNCHTVSLYDFLHRRLQLDAEIYEAIKVSPNNPKCIQTQPNTAATVMKIEKEDVSCPLDLKHIKLCNDNCTCARKPYEKFLIVTCTKISTVPLIPQYQKLRDLSLNQIRLIIEGNLVRRLPSKIIDPNYNDVTELHAAFNIIDEIFLENIPERLEFLDLKHNRLRHVSVEVIVTFQQINVIQFSSNPWNCSNSAANELIKFVKSHRKIAKDFSVIQCSNQKFFLEIDVDTNCNRQILIAVFFVLLGVLITTLTLIYYRNREAISEFLFKHDKFRIIERIADTVKQLDGIVIATEYDQVFGKYVTAKLMDKPNRFKIGLIFRDWPADESIPDNVMKNLRDSRRAIVVLTDHFEELKWSRWNHYNIGTRIIFILKGRVAASNIEIANHIAIKFNDPWFWDKLKHAMTNVDELNVDGVDLEMQQIQCDQ